MHTPTRASSRRHVLAANANDVMAVSETRCEVVERMSVLAGTREKDQGVPGESTCKRVSSPPAGNLISMLVEPRPAPHMIMRLWPRQCLCDVMSPARCLPSVRWQGVRAEPPRTSRQTPPTRRVMTNTPLEEARMLRSTCTLAAASLLVIACADVQAPPTQPIAFSHVPEHCALKGTTTEVIAEIDALIAQVNDLEAAGALGPGPAQALRNKLENALEHLEVGRSCAAVASLSAFREQVSEFLANAMLTEGEAGPLLDGVDHALLGDLVIAFKSNRDGVTAEIYAMRADGSGQTRLTSNPATDDCPAWSPDGSKIVFCSDRDGIFQLYTMNADGSEVTRLTHSGARDLHPAWSPDGTRIAFARVTFLANEDIFVMNADGTDPTPLTDFLGADYDAAWSPDGTRIAFVSSRDGHHHIFVMNADGTGVTRLTSGTGRHEHPAWSPDGTRIAFASTRDVGRFEIYVMNADGTGLKRLTYDGEFNGLNHEPTWSPDGRIAFHRIDTSLGSEVAVMNADGTGVVNLTQHPAGDGSPAWKR